MIRIIIFVVVLGWFGQAHAQEYVRESIQVFGYDEGAAFVDSQNWSIVSKTNYTPIEGMFSSPVPTGYVREYFLGVRKADNINDCGSGPDFRFWFTWRDTPGHQFSVRRDWGKHTEGTIKWVRTPGSTAQANAASVTSGKYWRIEARIPESCVGKAMAVYGIWIKAIDKPDGQSAAILLNADGPARHSLYKLGGIGGKIAVNNQSGNVGIGTDDPTARLAVNGTTKTKEIIVTEQASAWPDYVFREDYRLPDLGQLKVYVKTHRHLPNLPSAEEVKREGQNLGAIQAKLLEKIEELTLYVIDLKKENKELQKVTNQMKQELRIVTAEHYEK